MSPPTAAPTWPIPDLDSAGVAMAGKVVVVGSFNVDHAWRCMELPAPGATLAGEYRSGPGGKGFNQAVAAARASQRRTHRDCGHLRGCARTQQHRHRRRRR